MINQISLNSNNTIELSRGQLLTWINQLLGVNLGKIQQLGTGAIYCQLLDILYPNYKIPLNKVNFKAKSQYEYINNFKVLQQSFNKLSIMKHIDVERLIKCKYQDNLEFLQWFKKIYDNMHPSNLDQNQRKSLLPSRQNSQIDNRSVPEKENKRPASVKAKGSRLIQTNQGIITQALGDQLFNLGNLQKLKGQKNQKNPRHTTNRSKVQEKPQNINWNKASTQRISLPTIPKTQQPIAKQIDTGSIQQAPQKIKQTPNRQPFYSPSKFVDNPYDLLLQAGTNTDVVDTEKQFYLKKLMQIQHLLQCWNMQTTSSQLAENIRKILFFPLNLADSFQINEKNGKVIVKEDFLSVKQQSHKTPDKSTNNPISNFSQSNQNSNETDKDKQKKYPTGSYKKSQQEIQRPKKQTEMETAEQIANQPQKANCVE